MLKSRFKIASIYAIIVVMLFASFTIFKSGVKTLPKDDSKISKLKLPADFKAEHLYSPSDNGQGSWVAMTFDDKGRIIASDRYPNLINSLNQNELKDLMAFLMAGGNEKHPIYKRK